MKVIVLTRCTHNWNIGHSHLVNSLHHFGYDFKVIIDPTWKPWKNCHKRHVEWLRENRGEYTHILQTDAWDTLALGSVEELCKKYKAIANGKWLNSAEKNLFPKQSECSYVKYTPEMFSTDSPWRFSNGGGYIAPIDLFIDVVENTPRRNTEDEVTAENDNEWGNNLYVYYNNGNIVLDTQCEIFQTLFWEYPGDFSWKNERLVNNITKTEPIFIHGNGRSNLPGVLSNLGI